MLSLRSCPVFAWVSLIISLKHEIVGAKTRFLFDHEKEATSSLQQNYRLSIPKLKQTLNRVPQHLQNLQFENTSNKEAIHIIDPPAFTKNERRPYFNFQYLMSEVQDRAKNDAKVSDVTHMPNYIIQNYPLNNFEKRRPSTAFLIQPQSPNENGLLPPHQETFKHNVQSQQFHTQTMKQVPTKFEHFNDPLKAPHSGESHGYHSAMTQLQQLYPFQISAAVRHKEIVRTRPASLIPYIKQRVHSKKFKTFQSKILHNSSDFEEEVDQAQFFNIRQSNVTKKKRTRRDVNSRKKSAKLMHGSLLPVALTIMGENGELLTGRALLQHITVLLKNASAFESKDEEDDLNQFTNGDVLLNEKDFHRIMRNSMNLTDPAMLTVLGLNALNDSSLLTNTYVNEYLNCIDASKITNRFQALQTKIDCMKRKLFDNNNFDSTGSSRYSISNLPGALVYADVMSNIKNLVRPKNGIAFYSLPVDELTHLQQVVLPIEEYVSQIHSAHFSPRNYHNRKFFFNENFHSRMPTWYIVKPDGRIYQTEGSRNYHPATIFHGFPDIPNADVFVDGVSRGPLFESVLYDE